MTISTASKSMWCTGHDGIIDMGETFIRDSDGSVLCIACAAMEIKLDNFPQCDQASECGNTVIEIHQNKIIGENIQLSLF